MEVKKKNFLENLKTMFGNKKPGRKALAKQGRNLANRRSISVPDLRLVPGEAFSTENLEPDASDAIFFGSSPHGSDTDSVVRGSVTDGPLFTDGLSDSVPETTISVPKDYTSAGLHRLSAPVETLTLYEDIDKINSTSENKVNLTQETLYAQVTKRTKGNAPKVTFDPVSAPRHSNMKVLSPIPDLEESGSLSDGKESTSEETPVTTRPLSGTIAAALVRAHSLGEQGRPCVEKRDTSCEKGTPPIRQTTLADRKPLTLDMLENADVTSLESACGTPSEEQANMLWTIDSEEADREPYSPWLRELSMEETLVEETLLEEAQDEIAEVSFNISVILFEINTYIVGSLYLKF